ncbi:MAG TPA: HupE/UreJ family protein [Hyphomicrobiaceae bacterium]|nr:HupE/UreJ family protein [Hyphomicrobiaceae bacterium]
MAALLLPVPALAHHPMGGKRPETILQGLLSGIGHPVIGPDHLAFIVAIGFASAFVRGGLVVPMGFVISSALGVLAHAKGMPLPMVELLVALSVLAVGMLLFTGLQLAGSFWSFLAFNGGLVHGYALAESVLGSEQGVITAYVAGIAVVSFAIAAAAQAFAKVMTGTLGQHHPRVRAAGAVLGCLGAALVVFSLAPVAP